MSYKTIRIGNFGDKGKPLCLDVPGGRKKNGESLIAFPCHGGPNQQFRHKNGSTQVKHSRKCIQLKNHQIKQVSCKSATKKRRTNKRKTQRRRR